MHRKNYKKVNEQPCAPILYPIEECVVAAKTGDLEKLKFWIDANKVDVNVIDPATKQGLLHWAAEKGHVEIVKYLIAKKVDVNLRDECTQDNNYHRVCNRGTALHVAVYHRKVEVVRTLLENKANTNLRTYPNKTPLHYLMHRQDDKDNDIRDMTQLLLDHDADINVQLGMHNVIQHLSSNSGNYAALEVIDEHIRKNQLAVKQLTEKNKQLELRLAVHEEHKKERKEKKERKASTFSLLPPPAPSAPRP